MTRAEAFASTVAKFTQLTGQLGITLTDVTASAGPSVDAALLAFGIAESHLNNPTISRSDAPTVLALLDYYILDYLIVVAAALFDSQVADKSSIKESQIFAQLVKLREIAKKRLQEMGYVASDFVLGSIGLNYLEPEVSGL